MTAEHAARPSRIATPAMRTSPTHESHLEQSRTAEHVEAETGVAHGQPSQLQRAGVVHELLEYHWHVHTCAVMSK
jgi:hypothetical protein